MTAVWIEPADLPTQKWLVAPWLDEQKARKASVSDECGIVGHKFFFPMRNTKHMGPGVYYRCERCGGIYDDRSELLRR